jgi:tetratricopeptide (TPR) repeat protein
MLYFAAGFVKFMSVRQRYRWAALGHELAAFDALIAARRYDEALAFFREQLDKPTLFGLETSLRRAELLLKFFPDGEDAPPRLNEPADQAFVLYALALTLNLTGGYPGRAVPLYQRHDAICEQTGDDLGLSQSLGHHAKALRQAGRFRASEAVARRGLQVIRARGDYLREAVNLYWLGMGLAQRGAAAEAETALQRSLRIFRARFATQAEGVVNAFLAQRALWLGEPSEALQCANRAWEIGAALEADDARADLHGAVKINTAAARMQGEALVMLGDADAARERLDYALRRAREIEFVEEELPALRVLALWAWRENRLDEARERLARTWQLAERGPFKLYDADSYNLLAQIERAAGNREAAALAAACAFRLSWCDGPPFAYQRGLEDAQTHFQALGVAAPNLAGFNDARHEPLPEVEINPPDEFGS